MNKRYTSVFENGLIWFGAAVSIAEIQTGTCLAPLGMKNGLVAIIIGHIIGAVLLFLAGLIGGKTRKSSMENTKISFGSRGALIFSVLNIIQLIGWTGIMIYDGAMAANAIFDAGKGFWCTIIGILIVLWIVVGIKNLGKINLIAMISLFALTVILSFIIFKNNTVTIVNTNSISFGAALELSVAMPLSWLPLISDYTRDAKKPLKATAVSSIVYTAISCWMYAIGMGAAIFTSETDIAQIMLKTGFGIAGLVIIVLSTVTTTFLDAYSAGVSGETILKNLNCKYTSIMITVLGSVCASLFLVSNISGFLYFIGSVFAPMIAIQITDFYILKNKENHILFNFKNIAIWIIGFVIYRILMRFDILIGCTLLDVIITMLICVVTDKFRKGLKL